jgi:hypothetical protein
LPGIPFYPTGHAGSDGFFEFLPVLGGLSVNSGRVGAINGKFEFAKRPVSYRRKYPSPGYAGNQEKSNTNQNGGSDT